MPEHDCDNCPLKKRVDKLEEFEKSTISDITEIKTDIKYMKESLNTMSNDIKLLLGNPAKRWDTIITTIITVVVGGFAGAIVALVLRKG